MAQKVGTCAGVSESTKCKNIKVKFVSSATLRLVMIAIKFLESKTSETLRNHFIDVVASSLSSLFK